MDSMTTTSYAVLAHLAVQPWSAYELAQQLTRGFDLVWPRAESQVYEEPKRLARLGFAEASTEKTGRRTRTVYTITDSGRSALADWLAAPTEPTRVESEPLIRVFFAEHGAVDDLIATVEHVASDARELQRRLADQIRGYLDDGGPYRERWHAIALGAGALLEQARSWETWAGWALAEIDSWPAAGRALPDGERLLSDVAERFGLDHESPTREEREA